MYNETSPLCDIVCNHIVVFQLQNVLKDAFDDLIDDDEDEDTAMNHTDPSFHPEKYPTSTPFIAGKER